MQAHAPDMLWELADGASSYIITDGGEARAVMSDIRSYEALQDSLALLNMLTLRSQHVREGKIDDVDDTFARLRGQLFQETAKPSEYAELQADNVTRTV